MFKILFVLALTTLVGCGTASTGTDTATDAA